jgi:hypothetical protein
LIPKLSDQHGSIDRADEVTLSRKGAKGTKSRTGVRGPRSTGTKASRRVGKTRKSPPGSDKKLKARVRDLEKKLEASTRELAEALEQQTATSEVLGIISRSPGELEPVFGAMLANATRICEAKFGDLYLRDDNAFRLVAAHSAPAAYVEARTATRCCGRHPMLPSGVSPSRSGSSRSPTSKRSRPTSRAIHSSSPASTSPAIGPCSQSRCSRTMN